MWATYHHTTLKDDSFNGRRVRITGRKGTFKGDEYYEGLCNFDGEDIEVYVYESELSDWSVTK